MTNKKTQKHFKIKNKKLTQKKIKNNTKKKTKKHLSGGIKPFKGVAFRGLNKNLRYNGNQTLRQNLIRGLVGPSPFSKPSNMPIVQQSIKNAQLPMGYKQPIYMKQSRPYTSLINANKTPSKINVDKIVKDSLNPATNQLYLNTLPKPKYGHTGWRIDTTWMDVDFLTMLYNLDLKARTTQIINNAKMRNFGVFKSEIMKAYNVISNFIDAQTDYNYHFEQDEFGKVKIKYEYYGGPELTKFKENSYTWKDTTFEDLFNKAWSKFKFERMVYESFRQTKPADWDWYVSKINDATGLDLAYPFKTMDKSNITNIKRRINENFNKIIQNLKDINYPGFKEIQLPVTIYNEDETSLQESTTTENDGDYETKIRICVVSSLLLEISNKLVLNIQQIKECYIFIFEQEMPKQPFTSNFEQKYIDSLTINKIIINEYNKELDVIINSITDPITKEKVIEDADLNEDMNLSTSFGEEFIIDVYMSAPPPTISAPTIAAPTPVETKKPNYTLINQAISGASAFWKNRFDRRKRIIAEGVAISKVAYAQVKYGLTSSVQIGKTIVNFGSSAVKIASSYKKPLKTALFAMDFIRQTNYPHNKLLGVDIQPIINHQLLNVLKSAIQSGLVASWVNVGSLAQKPESFTTKEGYDEYMKTLVTVLEPTIKIFLNDLVESDCVSFLKEKGSLIIPNEKTLRKVNALFSSFESNNTAELVATTNKLCSDIIPLIVNNIKNKGVSEGMLGKEAGELLNNYLKSTSSLFINVLFKSLENNIENEIMDLKQNVSNGLNSFCKAVEDPFLKLFIDDMDILSDVFKADEEISAKEHAKNISDMFLTPLKIEVNLKDKIKKIRIRDFHYKEDILNTVFNLLESCEEKVYQDLSEKNISYRTSVLLNVVDIRIGKILEDICNDFKLSKTQSDLCSEKMLQFINLFTDDNETEYSAIDMALFIKELIKIAVINVGPQIIDDVLNEPHELGEKTDKILETIYTKEELEEVKDNNEYSYLKQYAALTTIF